MNNEAMIPKMTRINPRKRKIKIPLINFVIIFFAAFLIICSTFLNLHIKHYLLPMDIFSGKSLSHEDFIYSFALIPQIPIIMFITSVIGRKMALTSTVLYILIGLFFFPVFAMGGGLKYFGSYGFGYILGYIPAIVIAGRFLSKKYTYLNMFIASILGVLTIHICGILYMLIVACIRQSGTEFISHWVAAQSGIKILYDMVISFLLIVAGKYLHKFLDFIMY